MRGRVNAIRTFKGLVADLRIVIKFPQWVGHILHKIEEITVKTGLLEHEKMPSSLKCTSACASRRTTDRKIHPPEHTERMSLWQIWLPSQPFFIGSLARRPSVTMAGLLLMGKKSIVPFILFIIYYSSPVIPFFSSLPCPLYILRCKTFCSLHSTASSSHSPAVGHGSIQDMAVIHRTIHAYTCRCPCTTSICFQSMCGHYFYPHSSRFR